MRVNLPIDVPDGNYCWKIGIDCCCNFNNEGGSPECNFNIGNLKYNKEGNVKKPSECLKLKNNG